MKSGWSVPLQSVPGASCPGPQSKPRRPTSLRQGFEDADGTNPDKFDEAQLIIDVVDSGGTPVQQGGTSQLLNQNSPVTRDGSYSP